MFNACSHSRVVECLVPAKVSLIFNAIERDRQCEVRRIGVPDDDSFWGHLKEHAFIGIGLSVWSMHQELPTPLALEFEHFECVAEPIWAPPGSQLFRVREGRENFWWRKWEDSAGLADAIWGELCIHRSFPVARKGSVCRGWVNDGGFTFGE